MEMPLSWRKYYRGDTVVLPILKSWKYCYRGDTSVKILMSLGCCYHGNTIIVRILLS